MAAVIKIVKRSGELVDFDKGKIAKAIMSANKDVDEVDRINSEEADEISIEIEKKCYEADSNLSVEEIQNCVEKQLMERGYYNLAREYIKYRYVHTLARDRYKELMDAVQSKISASDVQNQNANVDEKSFGGRVGEASSYLMKKYALDYLMSDMAKNNHLNNEIYIHDLDSFAVGMHNCLSIPFDKLLKNGFNTRQTDVRAAGSVNTAMQLVAVIFQLQSLQQFGGVSATHIDWTMVPYVRKSFIKYWKDGLNYIKGKSQKEINEICKDINAVETSIEDDFYKQYENVYIFAKAMTIKEVHQSVEALYHNLNTLQSRSGNQLPFTSINYGTCTLPEGRMVTEEILNVSIEGIGSKHRTSIFPCGIFQCKKGVNRLPGEPNYDLFKLAIKSTSKRLYPNYANCDWSNHVAWENADIVGRQKIVDELTPEDYATLKTKLQENDSDRDFLGLAIENDKIVAKLIQRPETLFSTMGCRTVNGANIAFFDFYKKNINNLIQDKPLNYDFVSSVQKDGRGNIAPVTIILPTLAMEANRNVELFMELLNKKIDEAKDMLIERYNWIISQKADSAKFMYENGTMAGYIPEEGIESAMKSGTLVIGELGIAETLQLLVGCNQTKPEGMKLAKRIEKLYNEKCAEFKKQYHLNFGVYYTPAENLCHTALEKFRAKYGEIKNVSDKEFFTNSMHVPVWEEVSAFEKIDIESELTGYSNAGCITYVELDSPAKNNLVALERLVSYAMDKDIPYFAINVPNDMCEDCGYTDEIVDACPVCGSTKIRRLRRVTGYLTGDYKTAFNKGKQEEVEMRFQHTKKGL